MYVWLEGICSPVNLLLCSVKLSSASSFSPSNLGPLGSTLKPTHPTFVPPHLVSADLPQVVLLLSGQDLEQRAFTRAIGTNNSQLAASTAGAREGRGTCDRWLVLEGMCVLLT